MPSNLERYQRDLDALLAKGETLHLAIQAECLPSEFDKALKGAGEKPAEVRKTLPNFSEDYQRWYSEAKTLIRQILPDRLEDFVRQYEKPKPRNDITYANYTIEDCLEGLYVNRTRSGLKEKIVGPDAAIPRFRQQLAILRSASARFESSLFDIRQLVQADLLDSELDAAEVLAKNKFTRAAGALAGVVLEKHLSQVCDNHAVKVAKKDPSIAGLNDALKAADVIDIPRWRFLQHLGDIRNLCDHNETKEPTLEQVEDLVEGVKKVTKTLF
jgi:hypothetical protein